MPLNLLLLKEFFIGMFLLLGQLSLLLESYSLVQHFGFSNAVHSDGGCMLLVLKQDWHAD